MPPYWSQSCHSYVWKVSDWAIVFNAFVFCVSLLSVDPFISSRYLCSFSHGLLQHLPLIIGLLEESPSWTKGHSNYVCLLSRSSLIFGLNSPRFVSWAVRVNSWHLERLRTRTLEELFIPLRVVLWLIRNPFNMFICHFRQEVREKSWIRGKQVNTTLISIPISYEITARSWMTSCSTRAHMASSLMPIMFWADVTATFRR